MRLDYIALQTVALVVAAMAIAVGYVSIFQRIKDPRKRITALLVISAIIVNLVAFFGVDREASGFREGDWFAFTLLNGLFIGFYFASRFLKTSRVNWSLDQITASADSQTQMTDLVSCPGCGNKTISRKAALRSPQTCSICQKTFSRRAPRLALWSVMVFTFLAVLGSIYAKAAGLISQETSEISVYILFIPYLCLAGYSLKLREVPVGASETSKKRKA